jgi:hypothetical protein
MVLNPAPISKTVELLQDNFLPKSLICGPTNNTVSLEPAISDVAAQRRHRDGSDWNKLSAPIREEAEELDEQCDGWIAMLTDVQMRAVRR